MRELIDSLMVFIEYLKTRFEYPNFAIDIDWQNSDVIYIKLMVIDNRLANRYQKNYDISINMSDYIKSPRSNAFRVLDNFFNNIADDLEYQSTER